MSPQRLSFSTNITQTTTCKESSALEPYLLLCRRIKSIFYLPLLSPWNRWIMVWTQVVLFLDLTYTAFLLPIIVGFQVPDVGWGYGTSESVLDQTHHCRSRTTYKICFTTIQMCKLVYLACNMRAVKKTGQICKPECRPGYTSCIRHAELFFTPHEVDVISRLFCSSFIITMCSRFSLIGRTRSVMVLALWIGLCQDLTQHMSKHAWDIKNDGQTIGLLVLLCSLSNSQEY